MKRLRIDNHQFSCWANWGFFTSNKETVKTFFPLIRLNLFWNGGTLFVRNDRGPKQQYYMIFFGGIFGWGIPHQTFCCFVVLESIPNYLPTKNCITWSYFYELSCMQGGLLSPHREGKISPKFSCFSSGRSNFLKK